MSTPAVHYRDVCVECSHAFRQCRCPGPKADLPHACPFGATCERRPDTSDPDAVVAAWSEVNLDAATFDRAARRG